MAVEKKTSKVSLVFGVILVLIGLVILLDKLGVVYLSWKKILSILLVIAGAYLGYSGFGLNSNSKVFWGSILFFFGIYLFIDSFGFLNPDVHFFWPVVLITTGLAFLMSFVNRPNDFALLLPAVALVGIGVLFLLTNLGVIYSFEVWESVEKFWPVLLIILGLYLILKKR
ncbi:LiaI-LiaF-like domain-containing protein [Candidatus Chrysopegis kryptomonas]|jgi:hypothetical protein|uniref:DUF5668 domain-containing protein n=1 Tax=Candidatus Chryseopegocella kryptomonas TaxID=1633643 RepID=A0A0P1NU64_9BACT|nr:DUF5668 domain-containing protein [Candidatus Chrysopegis kryptomonas]CUT02608.1 hypothetical protein JGI23_01288 [Candidatus Chrysopegis kryptomonas]